MKATMWSMSLASALALILILGAASFVVTTCGAIGLGVGRGFLEGPTRP